MKLNSLVYGMMLSAIALVSTVLAIDPSDPSSLYGWADKKSLSEGKSDMTATTIDDFIYVAGGCIKNQTYDYVFQMYACGAPDYNPGFISKKLEVYSPKTDTFDLTYPQLPVARYRHAAAALSRKLYLIGGRDESDAVITQVDVLDTTTKTWSSFQFPEAMSDHAAFVIGSKLYIVGGYSNNYTVLDTTYVLDSSQNKFVKTNFVLNQARGDLGATVVDNVVYVFGGFADFTSLPLTSTEKIIRSSNGELTNWILDNEPIRHARGDCAVGVIDDRYFIFGGESKVITTGESIPINNVEIFDQIHGSWFEGGYLQSPRFRFIGASWRNSIFIFGGQYYLEGQYATNGSYYPLSSQVDEYVLLADGDLDPTEEITLHGSGTTNPSLLYWNVMDRMEIETRAIIRMSYRGIGSGAGQQEFVAQENQFIAPIDFASGDIPMSASNYNTLKNEGISLVHIPIAVGTVSVFARINDEFSNGNYSITLNPCILARIFSRKITTWDHPDLLAISPSLKIVPKNTPITVIHRVLGSSSTAGLTQYLTAACPNEWTLGSGATIVWPDNTVGVQGSAEMVDKINSTDYSIGYSESGHGVNADLEEVRLINKNGKYLISTEANVSTTVNDYFANNPNFFPKNPTDSFAKINLYDLPGDGAWPITLITYIYVRADITEKSRTASLLIAFIQYLLSPKIQAGLGEYGFIALPKSVLQYSLEKAMLAIQLPVSIPIFQFESLETTRPVTGAGPYVISQKRGTYNAYVRDLLRADVTLLRKNLNGLTTRVSSVESSSPTTSSTAIAAIIFAVVSFALILFILCIKLPSMGRSLKAKDDIIINLEKRLSQLERKSPGDSMVEA